jgi:hypothetical protein
LSQRNAQVIDEIRLWVNTDVQSDLDYFARMEQTHAKITRVPNPGPLNKSLYDASRDHYQFSDGIFRFYRHCVEHNTLYVKIDDDICYVHPDFFTNLFANVIAREKTNYACVGNVLNIPYTSKILQDRGTLDDKFGHSTGDPRCPFACTSGDFAVGLHRQILDIISINDIESVYFDSHYITGRARIGVMAWTGENFQAFGGRIGERDEVELTTRIPEMLLKPLWIVGNAVVAHFALSHQRAALEDSTNILGRYLAMSIQLNGDTAA